MNHVPVEWRCFHCDAVFTIAQDAQLHFGKSPLVEPLCQVDQVRYREMQDTLATYVAEDTDLHREVHRAQHQGIEAARKAEEAGYAKGLNDYQKLNEGASLALEALVLCNESLISCQVSTMALQYVANKRVITLLTNLGVKVS